MSVCETKPTGRCLTSNKEAGSDMHTHGISQTPTHPPTSTHTLTYRYPLGAFPNAGVWSKLGAGTTTDTKEDCQHGVYMWSYKQSDIGSGIYHRLRVCLLFLCVRNVLVCEMCVVFVSVCVSVKCVCNQPLKWSVCG